MFRRNQTDWLPFTVLVLAASITWAQPAPTLPSGGMQTPTSLPAAPAAPTGVNVSTTLTQAFHAAWQRQPEAQSRQVREAAAAARKNAADSWTVEPVALALSTRTDRLNGNQGGREVEAGVAIPLWLPGERSRTGAVADAEARVAASRVRAAQWRTAGSVRESYWHWQRARIEHDLARERQVGAQQFATDVAMRVKAGDLARVDQHQADSAMATADVSLAEAASALASALQRLRALTGTAPMPGATVVPEPVPEVAADGGGFDTRHPAITELLDRAEVARRSMELVQVQTRMNPELTLATTRDRSQFGDSYQQSITLGIRMPLGSDSRNQARLTTAQAEAIEAETQLRLERDQVLAGVATARIQLDSARTQLKASDKRSQLAQESRSFFQKSFRLGQTDLPTQLRIELETTDAQRQAARARIELAASISALRQALGLLPE